MLRNMHQKPPPLQPILPKPLREIQLKILGKATYEKIFTKTVVDPLNIARRLMKTITAILSTILPTSPLALPKLRTHLGNHSGLTQNSNLLRLRLRLLLTKSKLRNSSKWFSAVSKEMTSSAYKPTRIWLLSGKMQRLWFHLYVASR